MPNIQDLAQAAGAHPHHHGHHGRGSAESSSQSQTVEQLFSALGSSSTQQNPLDPLSIIDNPLTSAGVTTSNS